MSAKPPTEEIRLPITCGESNVALRPPLLRTLAEPNGGVELEELLEQMIAELRRPFEATPAGREKAVVITKLEEALLWERRRREVHLGELPTGTCPTCGRKWARTYPTANGKGFQCPNGHRWDGQREAINRGVLK